MIGQGPEGQQVQPIEAPKGDVQSSKEKQVPPPRQKFLNRLNAVAERVFFWRRVKHAEESGSLEPLTNSVPQMPESTEQESTSSLGEAYFIGTTIVGWDTLFPGGKVMMNGVEHTISPEKMAELREEQERKDTQKLRAKIREEARKRLESEEPYDFSAEPELNTATAALAEEARRVMSDRLRAHHVPEDEIEKRIAHLQLYYFAGADRYIKPKQSQTNQLHMAGEVDKNGLICFYPQTFPPESRLFWAVSTVPHEMSHGAMGRREIADVGGGGNESAIVGLARQGISGEEGMLLENAFAEIDTGRVFAILSERNDEILQQPIFQEQRELLANMTPETAREIQTNPAFAEVRIYLSIIKKVLAARNLGVPEAWIAIHGPAVGSEGLDQVVMLWKLARMIGYQTAAEGERAGMSQEQLVDSGLYFIEESRIKGTDDAHKMIRDVLGTADADMILSSGDHPSDANREAILKMVKAKEEQMNPAWKRERQPEESELY